MTKSNRHKKQRKQEKAKTQLTGVKKLSKAKNVVEPTLRVKKILIREQLKSSSIPSSPSERWKDGTSTQISDGDSLTTRWKQSVQDLLVSSNHHNVNIRKDAVTGLQEIASSKSPLIIRHLDKIIAKIAALTSDQESIIRKENIKLATMVISMISYDQLTPFWSMLIAHLKCTMTHLDLAVRYSAVSFIELLVDHHPILVYESSSVLLPSLLGLISTTVKSDASDKNIRKHVTTLKTEITGKHDDVAVRIKVLRLLSKCLQMSSVKTQDRAKDTKHRRKSVKPSAYLSLRYPFGYYTGQSEKDNVSSEVSSASYTDRFYSAVTADPFSSAFNDGSVQKNLNNWHEFVNSCIPVLIETWVEMSPSLANRQDHSNKTKGGNKKPQSSGFSHLGGEKDSKNNMGRRDGLHILNETHVGNMLSIAILLEQLLESNGVSKSFSAGDLEEQSKLVKGIKNAHGQNLLKYFFGLMPYESLKDSRRKDVMVINLKLFSIAGKLKIFEYSLKKKLQVFIEGMIGSNKFDEDHCKLVLEVIRFLDLQKAGNLPTAFLLAASKMGFHKIIVDFLSSIVRPADAVLQKDRNFENMTASLRWNEIVIELIDTWHVKLKHDEELQHLFELLTFIALRRLTDMNQILRSTCTSKLKELVSASEMPTVLDSAHRAFVYADAEDIFEREFTKP